MASRYDKNTRKQTTPHQPTKARKDEAGLTPFGDGEDRLIDNIEDQASTRYTDDVSSDEEMLFDDDEMTASIRRTREDEDRVADLEVLRKELEDRNARLKQGTQTDRKP
jgi:hypothetical protein